MLGTGWLRDLPHCADYTIEHDVVTPKRQHFGQKISVKQMVNNLKCSNFKINNPTDAIKLPPSKDLRLWCSPIENQESLSSCTAHAGVGLLEYFERRAFGKHIDASRLFLYKATRNLLHWDNDDGAYLRTTMEAMVLFGLPPEEYWPYSVAHVNIEPSSFCYAFAHNFQTISYYRLDPPNITKVALLERIKQHLAMNLPSMFGFTVYNSISQASNQNGGAIPYPSKVDRVEGGHAVVAVGYDDNKVIANINDGKKTEGAILIRNSWGEGWGDKGYGWLPYAYVLDGLAVDWWSLLKNEWVDTGQFS